MTRGRGWIDRVMSLAARLRGRLADELLDEIAELAGHGEPVVALENLLGNVDDADVRISDEEREVMAVMVADFGLDPMFADSVQAMLDVDEGRRRARVVTLAYVMTGEQLHELLPVVLGVAGYGGEWARFREAIAGPVEMPEELRLWGWNVFAARLPDAARGLLSALVEAAGARPGAAVRIVLREVGGTEIAVRDECARLGVVGA